MQAAAELRRQEEHRKVSKSNSMLQSTRSPSVWHVRRVLGSVSTVCGRSQAKAEEEACLCSRSDCLSESGGHDINDIRAQERARLEEERQRQEARGIRLLRARATTGHSNAAFVGRGGARESPC